MENHSGPYLRQRPIKPFERMLLYLGGKEVLEESTGKIVSPKML